jgi:hypothetical protein
MVASHGERVPMMKLEDHPGRASAAPLVHVTPSILVPLVHGSPNGGRHVTRARRDVGILDGLARSLGPAETAALQSLELLGHGGLDHRTEIAVGDGRPHQSLQSLELLAQLG